MHIARIDKDRSKRYRIYNDEGYLFSLYGSELRRFNIEEDCYVDDSVVNMILKDIIYKRARERALFLLDRRMYSYGMLRDKLVSGGFPISVIDSVMEFLEQYNYIDDRAYVEAYVNSYASRKSRKQLIYDLSLKGIHKELIDEFFVSHDYSEDDSFMIQFNKYSSGKNLEDPVVRQKIFRHFYSKGFAYSTIEKAFQQ